MTQAQIEREFATALTHFPTDVLRAGAASWTATSASATFSTDFGLGGGFDTYDLTVSALRPGDSPVLKSGDRVIWKNKSYTVARVENIGDGALYVIGLNRGSAARG